MSKRLNEYVVPSDAIQGEGSFVRVRAVLYGESKRLAVEVEALNQAEKVQLNERLIMEHIIAWNWVDDEGQPLPLPSEDSSVLDRLTGQEMAFLGEALSGDAARKK